MKARNPELAIIGGGAAATLFLAHFAELREIRPHNITLYDPVDPPGPGLAYATRNPAHILNVRARNMSAYHQNPDHFKEWLKAGEFNAYGGDDFVPRMIYGLYLQEVFENTLMALIDLGHSFTKNNEFVHRSVEKDTHYLIETDGKAAKADIVILASGNNGRRPFDLLDPWQADYNAMAKAGHVLIAGTGLSMVDCVLSLHHAGYEGEITAISRHGLLPAPHVLSQDYPPFLNAENMPRKTIDILRLLREHTKKAEQEDIAWQAVMDSIRAVSNTLWRELSNAERQKFMRHLLPFWTIHRHRMAPDPASLIHSLIDSGKLHIVKDTIRAVEPKDEGEQITVLGKKKTYKADHGFDCLGYHPYNGAFEYSFALGLPQWPQYLECTAIPEIRSMAFIATRQIFSPAFL